MLAVVRGVLESLLSVAGAADEETRLRGRLLLQAAWVLVLFLLLSVATTAASEGFSVDGASLLASAVVIWLARRGRVDAAARLFTAEGVAIYVYLLALWGANGARATVAGAVAVVVGAAVSPRLAVIWGVTCSAAVLGFGLAEQVGAFVPLVDVLEPGWRSVMRQLGLVALVAAGLRVAHMRLLERLRVSEREREHAVRALSGLNKSLDARLRERTARAEALQERQVALARRLSGDLRDEVAAVRAQVSALAAKVAGSAAAASLSRVERAATRLAEMAELLGEHAKVGQTELRPVAIDMSALVGDIVDEHRRTPEGARVAFRVGADLPATVGDVVLLRAVLENLIGNAVKFSRVHASPEVQVVFDGSRRAYVVSDNGVGFDPVEGEQLFQPFRRLHAASEFEGHGVGLANVKRIVERHGGRVWAEGRPGEGARFAFSLQPAGEGAG